MKTYSYDETLELLNAAVAKKGAGFVYGSDIANRVSAGPECHYAWNGEPDCIVGHVLAAVGVPLDEMHYNKDGMEESEYAPVGAYSLGDASHVIAALANDGVVDFSSRAISLLLITQRHQDAGYPWGEAVAIGAREECFSWHCPTVVEGEE